MVGRLTATPMGYSYLSTLASSGADAKWQPQPSLVTPESQATAANPISPCLGFHILSAAECGSLQRYQRHEKNPSFDPPAYCNSVMPFFFHCAPAASEHYEAAEHP